MVALYFDHAATTPLLPEVRDTIVDSMDVYGNPSSLHRLGLEAERRLEASRQQVGRALGVTSGRIVFTGSGTEANNLAILGAAQRFRGRGQHLVTTAVEHASVLETMRALERAGWWVTYVRPEANGMVSAQAVLDAVTTDTVLVSMMHVNNETGALLPVDEVANALRPRKRVVFHVDGIQAFGKIPHAAAAASADLYTVSGHKVGAPKGIGGLFVRAGLELDPLVHGGGQEFGLRSGTQNLLGIFAFGTAAHVRHGRASHDLSRLQILRDSFVAALAALPGCRVTQPASASPYIVNASFEGLRGEVLLHALEAAGLFVSTGSACSSHGGRAKPSHVLTAMGQSEEEMTGAIRFSLSPDHTQRDVDDALDIIRAQVAWLRNLL